MSNWTDVWTDTEFDAPEIDVKALQAKAGKLQRTLVRRNRIEMAAGVFVVASFSFSAAVAPTIQLTLANGLVALGGAIVTALLYVKGRLGPPDADPGADTAAYLTAHRAELQHQVKLLRWVPLWYLGPLVPGILAMAVADYGLNSRGATFLGVSGLIFAGIAVLNHFAANQLQAEQDALPNLDFGGDT